MIATSFIGLRFLQLHLIAAVHASLPQCCLQDPIVGVDCEWKPDQKAYENSIAMIQLASSSCAVLIRTCKFGGIPEEVFEFCKCALVPVQATVACHI